MDKERSFHVMEAEEVITGLNSRADGLTGEEAVERLSRFGPNELEEGRKKSTFVMFLEQFKNIMVAVLLAAAVLSAVVGKEITDAAIILVVVILNAVLGVVQESKAEKGLAALKQMSSPFVKVKRSGGTKQIKTEELVPGDIVLIEAGDIIAADMRLVESASLKIEEAALTGESVPVEKHAARLDEIDAALGDRKNMVYAGSHVTYGRGLGVVVETGMHTEVGRIAGHLLNAETNLTPLQKKLAEMSKILSIGVLFTCIIIFGVGKIQGRDTVEMFLTAVSLAVAAIPEGLPAVVTIVLAIGVQKMAGKNAIVRKLSAVETLGCTQIICSDKTGTLTQNKMTVKEVFLNNKLEKAVTLDNEEKSFNLFVSAMVLCNDSKFQRKDEETTILGDPTETALVDYGIEMGISKETCDKENPRISEIPFDSDRKLMTTLNRGEDGIRSITKGAPDILLGKCTHIILDGEVQVLTDSDRQAIKAANKTMADHALRVLAVAEKILDSVPENMAPDAVERDLIFIGLVGMIDPPRPEAAEAVEICREAGIRPIMITGDHRDTAAAIAREIGIAHGEDEVITGSELNSIPEEEFTEHVSRYSVYARVSPEHKVRIVKAWKANGKVVAMTGDGVNDAPALKAADIGVGMGITGTEVSKSVSNIVLADDNFATIVHAVEEGRKIYSNIRKTIQFLLSCNLGEVFVLFIGTLFVSVFGAHILYPIHILWINLITDTLPALALGMEKAEKGVMQRKPRDPAKSFYSGGVGINIIYQGFVEGSLVLAVFMLGKNYSPDTAITMAFASLGLIQLFHSFNARSNEDSLLKLGILSNPFVLGAFFLSAFLQLSVIFLPFMNAIFRVVPLNAAQWLIVTGMSFLIIPVVEMVKLFQRVINVKPVQSSD